MPRKKPIPVARTQFSQWQGMPGAMPRGAVARMPLGARPQIQNRQGQIARQARTQVRNPMARRAQARPRAMGANRQSEETMRERASTRPAGLKAEWQQSFWFQIPLFGSTIFGPLADLLRNLVYPQEHLRTMKRSFVGTGIGTIAKKRFVQRLERQRQEKQARQRAIVQRNRPQRQRQRIARKQASGAQNYPEQKAA